MPGGARSGAEQNHSSCLIKFNCSKTRVLTTVCVEHKEVFEQGLKALEVSENRHAGQYSSWESVLSERLF